MFRSTTFLPFFIRTRKKILPLKKVTSYIIHTYVTFFFFFGKVVSQPLQLIPSISVKEKDQHTHKLAFSLNFLHHSSNGTVKQYDIHGSFVVVLASFFFRGYVQSGKFLWCYGSSSSSKVKQALHLYSQLQCSPSQPVSSFHN